MTADSSNDNSNSRWYALGVIALGIVLMVGSVFADSLGISGGGDGFGWKQLIAAIVGLVVLLGGVAWLTGSSFSEAESDTRGGHGTFDRR